MRKSFVICILTLWVSLSLPAQTKLVAHRGFWDTAGAAQNSIASLVAAHEVSAYGSELDVMITADGIPVVHHDDKVKGMRIEDVAYDRIKDIRLKNGECIPTFESYLQKFVTLPGLKLIVEIKPHKRIVNEDRAVSAVVALVEKYQLENRVEFISFSMNICKETVDRAPYAPVAYLNGDVAPADLKRLGLDMDYHYDVLKKNPSWIQEAKNLGVKVNVWTVNDAALMEYLIGQGVDFITTDKPLDFNRLISK